jgi:Recombinase zinc beta ribbon domain
MTPIENMFPAVVEPELYWRVNRRLTTKAPRGRNASTEQKSIVAGIMFCASCGHAVTRVSKGKYVYLVCSRANMRAEGCNYLAVPYDRVEDALRSNARRIVNEAPRGKSATALDKQIDTLRANVEAGEQIALEYAELAALEKSPTARRKLTEVESELRGHRAALRELMAKRDTLTTASVKDRLKGVEQVLKSNADVSETNTALRDATLTSRSLRLRARTVQQ